MQGCKFGEIQLVNMTIAAGTFTLNDFFLAITSTNKYERHHPTNSTSLENEHCSDNEPKLPCTGSPQSPTGIRSTEMLSCSPDQEWLSWLPWRMCTGEEAPTEGHDLLPATSGLPQALQQQGNVAAATNLCLQTLPCKNSIPSPYCFVQQYSLSFLFEDWGKNCTSKALSPPLSPPKKEWNTASHQLLTVFISLFLPSTQPLSPSSTGNKTQTWAGSTWEIIYFAQPGKQADESKQIQYQSSQQQIHNSGGVIA